ncbi:uncharacterized protein A1O5_11524 [Cladophialophora psammophila CBS 110553]|uniref:G-patch domain-containing protein n=1 Tax=Cladophialophora psammophila CBS 110553 TaxID=1182543 RepID=W9WER0_9EURO|nr:uncharacterized protein A1O5_11524 [Cladophialophora psammophila CBS 110553]EXJ63475.1 hypothetical protein A1O5_11524 [Cladophialophora psammophila CBS 110553]
MAEQDEDYYLPLRDQRVFGAGIRRKKIDFVPASKSDSQITPSQSSNSTSAGSRYLSIVLAQSSQIPDGGTRRAAGQDSRADQTQGICAVCHQPIPSTDKPSTSHESSIAHQVCLKHSHPPSSLDRERVGLRYLSTYGWDPDSRRGLGARQEGIRVPIKAKAKNDTVGLRETVDEDTKKLAKKKMKVQKEDKIVKLSAKQVRIKDDEAKKRAEKLRQMFYGPDLEKYLGPNN